MVVRVALVGLGMAVTPHARGLLDLAATVEVASAFSPSAERRAAFARAFAFPIADSLDAILDDVSIDAVVVLTPPNTHLDIVRRCAAAGKHVLLEKPLEVSTPRAEELVRVCRDAGVRLGIVLQHRFRPSSTTLAGLLRAGALGDIVGCSAMMRLWRTQAYYDEPGRGSLARDGGGVLMSQGIHTLDLMLSLAGPVAEVTAFTTTTALHRMETEDLVAAAVRFDSGAFGVIDATTAAYPGFQERIEIAGTKGSATLAGTALSVRFLDGRAVEIAPDELPGGAGADPMAFSHAAHRAVLADFAAAIVEGRDPAVTGAATLGVHRLIDALTLSGKTGGRVAVARLG